MNLFKRENYRHVEKCCVLCSFFRFEYDCENYCTLDEQPVKCYGICDNFRLGENAFKNNPI